MLCGMKKGTFAPPHFDEVFEMILSTLHVSGGAHSQTGFPSSDSQPPSITASVHLP